MAGIYIHIPFCKTRCIYCDFYSTTHSEMRGRYVKALCKELKMRKNYLAEKPVETIYIGGGTPSLLKRQDFIRIFDTIGRYFDTSQVKEVTIEANPDDLSDEYLRMLSSLPFNRLSMGIQTFDDSMLKLLNRRHSGQQAKEAVQRCRQHGFQNISIDLIYGLPGETLEQWEYDLKQAIELNPEHISAYHLTYEEGTQLYTLKQNLQVKEVDEETSCKFFQKLVEMLGEAGYEHYEISNFCLPGKHSRHNSSYWDGTYYLGCGPSAHSYNGEEREWNVRSLQSYMEGIEEHERRYEVEKLSTDTQYNDFIITRLRTRQGVPIGLLEEKFGNEKREYCLRMADPYLKNGKLTLTDGILALTREGIFVSDSIMRDLMWVG